MRNSDHHMKPLHKVRNKFIIDLQPYVLETVTNLPGNPTFLRVESFDPNVKIPPFIKVM